MLPTPDLPSSIDYDRVYEPLEDSFLLLDALEEELTWIQQHNFTHTVPLVLEIGSGSGIISLFILKNILPGKSLGICTDLNPYACMSSVETLKLNKVSLDSIQTSSFQSLCRESIDLMVFNPPYVPADSVPTVEDLSTSQDKWLDLALDGGEDGMVVTYKVLQEMQHYIASNGVAYILFCERNKPSLVIRSILDSPELYGDWEISLVMKRKCAWEVLSIYKFMKINR